MENTKINVFKYKGKVFLVAENDTIKGEKAGVRFNNEGKGTDIIIILNKNLEPYKKRIGLHRLITGRGLRPIKTV